MSGPAKGGMIREVPGAVWGAKRVWLLHVAGNAALAALGYAWLWIPDAKIWQVAGSALLGLALVTLVLWLHGATLSFFHATHSGEEARVRTAFRATLPRLPAIWTWLIVFAGLLWLVGLVEDQLWNWAATTASWLTLKLQKPFKPEKVFEYYDNIAWAVRWLLVPLALLTLAAQASLSGFSGFGRSGLRSAWHSFRSLRYWAAYVALFLAGHYLPHRLVWWVPGVEGLGAQAASAAARILPAYLLAVTAWLLLLSLLAWLARKTGGEAVSARRPEAEAPKVPDSAAAD